MYWNGDRWLPQEPERVAKPAHRSYRRFRDWAATGIMVVVLAALAIPFVGAAGATTSGTTLITNWSTDFYTSVVQESSTRVAYTGAWTMAYHKNYLGGKAKSTNAAGAKAILKFKGSGVAWVGPMGPTRGKAKVYLDGTLVATVDSWASSFRPARVLFKKTWASVRWHTITLVTSGTAGRPTVALDAFVQRKGPRSTTTSTPAPTPTPAATPAPTAAPTADPTPTIAPTPTPTSTPVTTGAAFGSAIGADSLANTQVGGQYNLMTSYRFRAQTSSALNSVRIYVVDGTGYAGGTGGSVEVSIQTDDGTSSHLPTGTRLASATIRTGNPVSIGYLPLVTFATPPRLTAGTHYHVVFRNVDASPTVNFVSVNSLIVRQPPSPQQPRFADLDWTQLMKASGGSWTARSGFTPILALNYANGRQDGQGYMEVWIRGYERIAGASYMARESFTVTGANRTVSSVGVRLKRTGGTSPLVIRLETAAGVKLAEANVPAASIAVQAPDSFGYPATWATAALSAPVTLAAGQRYNLRLSTASGTEYSVYAIRQGVDYGFGSTTHFGDGLAYRTVNGGSTWETFGYGGAHYGQSDLQFFLR